MALKVVLVGRPNVGKSALFNRICKKRIAIVDDQIGVTRDRLYAQVEWDGVPFTLVDTGGLDPTVTLPFQEEVEQQTLHAVREADAAILVVDGQVGPIGLDRDVAKKLLASGKPVIVAINKVDSDSDEQALYAFHCLGIKDLMLVSALHNYQIDELVTMLLGRLSQQGAVAEALPEPHMRVALIGRPNVGKSTLFNRLIQEERSIISPIAGTTRDPIDSRVVIGGKEYLFIDTAGLRKRVNGQAAVEQFSAIRARDSIERADICLFILDVTIGAAIQEKRLFTEIEQAGKSCILLCNKWDMVKAFRMEHVLTELHREIPFAAHCPTLFISAQQGRNVGKILPMMEATFAERKKRITTGVLNQFVEACIRKLHPPMLQGKRLRIYYMTQVETSPPRFIVFINKREWLAGSYEKYLVNQFRETFGFGGTPLQFEFRERERRP